VGDVEVKEKLFVALENFIQPIREKRAKFEKDPAFVDKIMRDRGYPIGDIVDYVMRYAKSIGEEEGTKNRDGRDVPICFAGHVDRVPVHGGDISTKGYGYSC